jgi:hypothetical protein
MAFYHAYLAVENVNMTTPQDHIQLGRVRNDGQAYIAEALFDEVTISQQAFEAQLATILGVARNRINAQSQAASYSAGNTTLVQTYRNQTASVFTLRVFGGWPVNEAASLTECLAYLAANSTAWTPQMPSPPGS